MVATRNSDKQSSKERAEIYLSGLVQGVGFRPFVYRMAVDHRLVGFVQNLGDAGVKIVVEGERTEMESFIDDLKRKKPLLASYREIVITRDFPRRELSSFMILESDSSLTSKGVSYASPDIATCDQCILDLKSQGNRRRRYPFVVCSSCGPRFTVIETLPYDRANTTMIDFPMCDDCRREYLNPSDRRFHAEPVCCPVCGPSLSFSDLKGEISSGERAVEDAAEAIRSGRIVAVKGIGGTHLAVKATSDEAVLCLRERRRRPTQPFAVMSPNPETAGSFAEINEKEHELLISHRRPIVALRKSPEYFLSEWISPGLHTVGVMLPYSGIHHLLIEECREPAIVLTSGNYPGLPMAIENSEILQQSAEIADFFLLHNRRIQNRCDDSVVRDIAGVLIPIRRSRGYVPEPIGMPIKMRGEVVFASGVEEKSTSCILKDGYCFLSQHIGDVDSLQTLEFLKTASERLWQLCGVERLDVVACDLHPLFLSTRWARELSEKHKAKLQPVQHHHAHLVSLMAESGIALDEQIIGITLDGVGYGEDSTSWGGEILISGYEEYERVGHLETQRMPGGDLCARFPIRMAASILSNTVPLDEISELLHAEYLSALKHGASEVEVLVNQLKAPEDLPLTSSAGRVLDAAAALLAICFERTYDGEPAMRLESTATHSKPNILPLHTEISDEGGVLTLRTSQMIHDLLERKKQGERIPDLACAVQLALAKGAGEMAAEIAQRESVRTIGLSGGVAYNDQITRKIEETVTESGLHFLKHRKIPPGDAGASAGQALVAWARSR